MHACAHGRHRHAMHGGGRSSLRAVPFRRGWVGERADRGVMRAAQTATGQAQPAKRARSEKSALPPWQTLVVARACGAARCSPAGSTAYARSCLYRVAIARRHGFASRCPWPKTVAVSGPVPAAAQAQSPAHAAAKRRPARWKSTAAVCCPWVRCISPCLRAVVRCWMGALSRTFQAACRARRAAAALR